MVSSCEVAAALRLTQDEVAPHGAGTTALHDVNASCVCKMNRAKAVEQAVAHHLSLHRMHTGAPFHREDICQL